MQQPFNCGSFPGNVQKNIFKGARANRIVRDWEDGTAGVLRQESRRVATNSTRQTVVDTAFERRA